MAFVCESESQPGSFFVDKKTFAKMTANAERLTMDEAQSKHGLILNDGFVEPLAVPSVVNVETENENKNKKSKNTEVSPMAMPVVMG